MKGNLKLFPAEEPCSLVNRRAQSHEQVLGGRLAATTSFTVNRMGKQQEEKITGMGQVNLSFTADYLCGLLLHLYRFRRSPSTSAPLGTN